MYAYQYIIKTYVTGRLKSMSSITLNGSPLHTVGNLPAIGSQAPDFIATKTDLSELQLSNLLGQRILLNIFPSLDTPTCAHTMIQFNEMARQYTDYLVLCISADLPFAQKRFCAAEHADNVIPVSTFRHREFGLLYGVEIKDGPLAGLLSRAVIIIDEKGLITYTQQVKELANEPHYDAVLTALKK